MLNSHGTIRITKNLSPSEIPQDAVSIITHQPTAALIGRFLNRQLRANQTQVVLTNGDTLYVVTPKDDFGRTFRPRGYRDGVETTTFSIMRVEVLKETHGAD